MLHAYAKIIADIGCTRILNDCRKASVKRTAIEIYELFRMIVKTEASFGTDARQVRRALASAKKSEDCVFMKQRLRTIHRKKRDSWTWSKQNSA